MKKFDIDEVRDFIARQTPETKVYIGCDSYRFKKEGVWYARYTTVCVVHINGKNGCRVFGDIDTERDYDQKKDAPRMRMMNEVYRSVGMYLKLAEVIGDREIELHVDINKDKKHGSNVAYAEAMGYVRGVCGIDAVAKPDALASSFAADHFRTYGGKKEGRRERAVAA
jgi:predicted RNase H-related nuclease YkuK (DUF458 family)